MVHQQEISFMVGMLVDASIKCFEEKLHITSNLGSGEEISIKQMIETVIEVSGKDIKINWDSTKPNGDKKINEY